MTTQRQQPTASGEITAVQAAWLTDLSPKAINAAIDKGELAAVRKAVSKGRSRRLNASDVLYLALRKNVAPMLSRTAKRELYRCLVTRTDWSQPEMWAGARSDWEISLGSGLLIIQAKSTFRLLAKRWEALRQAETDVVSDRDIRGGEPVIRGTRIPVYMISDLVAQGAEAKELFEDYPSLNARKVRSALAYASTHPRRGRPTSAPWKDQRTAQAVR